MSILVTAGDQDIVKVDESKIDRPQHTVHQSLEGLRCVLWAEGHSNEFEKSEGVMIAVFGTSFWGDWNLMEAADEINHREYGHPCEAAVKILYMRQRITVVDGDRIQTTIVAAGTPASIGLRNDV